MLTEERLCDAGLLWAWEEEVREKQGGRASERSGDGEVNKTEKENIPEACPKPA